MPVTVPNGSTVAMLLSDDTHVLPRLPPVADNVILPPAHTLVGPLIGLAIGSGLTVIE